MSNETIPGRPAPHHDPEPFAPGPATLFRHDHPPVVDAHAEFDNQLTLGQRVADRVASVVGSWPFIIIQSVILFGWIVTNIYVFAHWKDKAFDPYPFILLNLVLSFQAAYTGPIVMMSQNRQSEKDRCMAQNDFNCNMTAEQEIRIIMEHLSHQDAMMEDMRRRLAALHRVAIQRDTSDMQ